MVKLQRETDLGHSSTVPLSPNQSSQPCFSAGNEMSMIPAWDVKDSHWSYLLAV